MRGALGVVRSGGSLPHYVFEGHEGVFYNHSTATWMYCRTCGLEGKHRGHAVRDGYHLQHFRLMHNRAKANPYAGRHRRVDPPKRVRVM